MQSLIESSEADVSGAAERSAAAFRGWSALSAEARAQVLVGVADSLEAAADELISIAAAETHLTSARLQSELQRACAQWRAYGRGAAPLLHSLTRKDEGPPTLLKKYIPLGPVAVFGASNFPFAYSTAGGDTASALAAGCTVIIKGHPAHPRTSAQCARIIRTALADNGQSPDLLIHLEGSGHNLGRWLVTHPLVAAVGFTGSLAGGRQLFDWAAARPVPIPVFAEMGSTNPVFLLPPALRQRGVQIAEALFASVTGSAGQFCTKPGLLIALEGADTEAFAQQLALRFSDAAAVPMLHAGIAEAYGKGRTAAAATAGVSLLSGGVADPASAEGQPLLARVAASRFLRSPALAEEVFGPFTLLVVARDREEMMEVARSLAGQLTASVFAADPADPDVQVLLPLLERMAGRLIWNGVPTGVTVSPAMHHGGPYPAATDPRFTAVGTDALLRWLRPLTLQNFPAR